jgi:hypothetical protein
VSRPPLIPLLAQSLGFFPVHLLTCVGCRLLGRTFSSALSLFGPTGSEVCVWCAAHCHRWVANYFLARL